MHGDNRQRIEQEHFDKFAEQQGEIWWGNATEAGRVRLQRRARLLINEIETYSDPSVLELGCGTGAFTQHILIEHPSLRLEGIDVSPKCIEIASARLGQYPNARFRTGDATALENENDSIDAVVGNSVLHHLPLEESARESLRVLKRGGIFWFSEPNMMNPEVFLEKNVRFIGKLTQTTPDETAFIRWRLSRALQQVGFTRIDVRPFDYLHPLVPKPLIGFASAVGNVLERTPILKEFTGSLLIKATK